MGKVSRGRYNISSAGIDLPPDEACSKVPRNFKTPSKKFKMALEIATFLPLLLSIHGE